LITAESKYTAVTFDGATITIDRNAPGRHSRDTYALAQLSGVQLSPPRLTQAGGRFTLVMAGGVQRGSRGSARLSSAGDDPLTVIFSKSRLPQFQALADAITRALAGAPAQPQAVAAPAAPDLAGQLAQLAALRDSGALSDAEFAAAKARLLGQAALPQDQPPTGRAW